MLNPISLAFKKAKDAKRPALLTYTVAGDPTKKIECNSTQAGAAAVTNYEYEVDLNEEKRKINLLRNDYLGIFIDEFKSLLV